MYWRLGIVALMKSRQKMDFFEAWQDEAARSQVRTQVTLLHCTSQYPAPFDEVNLKAMATLKHTFGLDTGYSDHTNGISSMIAAAALGASVLEKHITLDKTSAGPDHAASLEPSRIQRYGDMESVKRVLRWDLAKKPFRYRSFLQGKLQEKV